MSKFTNWVSYQCLSLHHPVTPNSGGIISVVMTADILAFLFGSLLDRKQSGHSWGVRQERNDEPGLKSRNHSVIHHWIAAADAEGMAQKSPRFLSFQGYLLMCHLGQTRPQRFAEIIFAKGDWIFTAPPSTTTEDLILKHAIIIDSVVTPPSQNCHSAKVIFVPTASSPKYFSLAALKMN